MEIVRSQYERFKEIEGRTWGVEGATIELVKQVGELAKYVMVTEGYYPVDICKRLMEEPRALGYSSVEEAIGDELADVFRMIIRIANHYDIDFERAHIRAKEGEDKYFKTCTR